VSATERRARIDPKSRFFPCTMGLEPMMLELCVIYHHRQTTTSLVGDRQQYYVVCLRRLPTNLELEGEAETFEVSGSGASNYRLIGFGRSVRGRLVSSSNH
jgi:hypothetical protein